MEDTEFLKGKFHVSIKYKDQWKHATAILNKDEYELFMKDLETHYHEGECHCFIKLDRNRVPRNQIEIVETQDAVMHQKMIEQYLNRS